MAAVVIAIVIAFLAVFALPFLFAAIEVALVVVGAVVAALSRVLLGRPWQLEAISDRGGRQIVHVHGWRGSQDQLSRAAELLEAGIPIPGAVSTSPSDDQDVGAGSATERQDARHNRSGTASSEESDVAPPSRSARATTWASVAMVVLSLLIVAGLHLGPQWLWRTDCPAPGVFTGVVGDPVLPATLVGAGTMSLEDAVGGKYGSDARRSAIESGSLVSARHEDWQTDRDVTLLRLLTFRTQEQALEYAAVDAETICGFVESTFSPEGVADAAGVRQPWRSGPPGWWAGVVVDRTYARAYVRSAAEDRGPRMVTDALKRAIIDRS